MTMSAPRSAIAEAPASTRFRSAVLAIAVLTAGACGRLGFEAREQGGDGGPPDARDGDGDGGTTTPDGGPMPVGCDEPLVVTTSADEDDAGEAPVPPHLGAGLSLREAIGIANARTGLDCITFSGVTSVSVGAELPALEDPDGTGIDGGGGVQLGGSVPIALRLVSSNNQIYNLELTGVQVAIQVNGPDNLLRGLHIHDCASTAIVVAAAAEGTEIGPCAMHDNGDTAIQAVGSIGLKVRNCTLANNGGSGIDATAGGTDVFVENSIIAGNRDYGVAVDPEATATVEYNDLQNRLEDCLNCVPGEGSISANPMFVDDMAGDYTLMTGSPAIDKGRVNGVDVNGEAAGDFNGLAPDMGGLESP